MSLANFIYFHPLNFDIEAGEICRQFSHQLQVQVLSPLDCNSKS